MYMFQSESTLYSCLNVKELLAQCRCKISSWCDCNWTRTQNHLVRKWTLNHLAKLASHCSHLNIKICFQYFSLPLTELINENALWLAANLSTVPFLDIFDCSCCECTRFKFVHSKFYWWTQVRLPIYKPGKNI